MIAADRPICLPCWLWYIYNKNNWLGILMSIWEDSQDSDKHEILGHFTRFRPFVFAKSTFGKYIKILKILDFYGLFAQLKQFNMARGNNILLLLGIVNGTRSETSFDTFAKFSGVFSNWRKPHWTILSRVKLTLTLPGSHATLVLVELEIDRGERVQTFLIVGFCVFGLDCHSNK